MSYARQSADASNRLTRSNYKGGSLLKQVRGKPTSSSPIRHGSREPSPMNWDAPPESSSDEDESPAAQGDVKTSSDERKSERNLRAARGNEMSKTEAGSSKREASSSSPRNSKARFGSDIGWQTPDGILVKATPDNENEEPDWVTQSQSQRSKKRQKFTYSQRDTTTNIHTAKRPQKSSQPAPTSQETKTKASGFLMPRRIDLHDGGLKKDISFKKPGFADDGLEDMRTKTEAARQDPGFEHPREVNDLSERHQTVDTSNFKLPLDIKLMADKELQSQVEAVTNSCMLSSNTLNGSTYSSSNPKSIFVPPGGTQVANTASTSSSTMNVAAVHEKNIFEEPETHDSSSSFLSSPGSVNFSQQEQEEFDADIATYRIAKCPMCKQPVPHSVLQQWRREKKTTVRHQRQFCKAHRKSDAENAWKDKRYPIINWSSFESRIKKHFPLLKKILRGGAPSFYRNAFESSIKTGEDRTLQKTVMGGGGEKLSAGYYGPKGTQKMTAAIISDFASLLRRLSTTDRLLSSSVGGGVPHFVQMVLVPELTVLLVKEDMGVDDEVARVVLQESETAGMAVNGEEDAEGRDLEIMLREDELRIEGERAKGDIGLM